jgi:hypothetical protein
MKRHKHPLRTRSSIVVSLALVSGTTLAGELYIITSPAARTRVEIAETAGQLIYSVNWQDNKILLPSRVDLFDGMSWYVGTEKMTRVFRGRKFERPQVLMQDGHPTYLYAAPGANLNGGSGAYSCVFRINKPKELTKP